MRPRKSSTSSAEPRSRPRYLGLEVAGAPTLSPRALESALRDALAPALPAGAPVKMRLIRVEAGRAIAEVPHTALAAARTGWNGPIARPNGSPISVRTRRTWGTLRKGKAWLRTPPRRSSAPAPPPGDPPGAPR